MNTDWLGCNAPIADHSGRQLVKVAVGAVILAGILALAFVLPAIETVLPGPDAWLIVISWAAFSFAVTAVLLAIAPGVSRFAMLRVDGSAQFTADVGSMAYWGTVLTALLVLHRGMSPLVEWLLDGWVIVYDVTFLVVALPPFLIVALRSMLCLGPLTERLVRWLEPR